MNGLKCSSVVSGVALSLFTASAIGDGGDATQIHACVDAQNVLKLSGPDLTCDAGETSTHWSIEGPPGPTDPVLLGRISTLEAQVATLQSQMAGLIDPALPDVLVSDVSLLEGTGSNSTGFEFTISLSMPSTNTVSVDFFTTEGTADSTDYSPVADRLLFFPGDTSAVIRVAVGQDSENELEEIFFLEIGEVVNAAGTGASGIGTIGNDDFPTVSISGQETGFEGDLYVYDVDLSEPAPFPVLVDYNTADGTAIAAEGDYLSNSGTLTFNPGETRKQVSVQTDSDGVPDGQETFSVLISNPVSAALGTTQVQSLLHDTDLTVSILDASVIEGNSGLSPATIMEMPVVLDQAVSSEVTVRYGQKTGGSARNHTIFQQDGDVRVIPFSSCNAVTNPGSCPTLVFAPGETQKLIRIEVVGDTRPEANENFFVMIFESTNAAIADELGEGLIIDDD